MYKIVVRELLKATGEEDNEPYDVSKDSASNEAEATGIITSLLSTLGGTYGRWLEVSVED